MKERLQIIINELLMSISAFARSVDVSDDTIRKILNGKLKPSATVLKKILETYPNINRDWFETGKGEMFTWKNNSGNTLNEKSTGYLKSDCEHCKSKDMIIAEYKAIIRQQRVLIDSLLKQNEELNSKLNR